MSKLASRLRRALRGEIAPGDIAREAARRAMSRARAAADRATASAIAKRPARLLGQFAKLGDSELLHHFQIRTAPVCIGAFSSLSAGEVQRSRLPAGTDALLAEARRIADDHCWPLMGFGQIAFGEEIDWLADVVAQRRFPLIYHRDLTLWQGDGSDIRVVWELNRFGHAITLARAYAVSGDAAFSREFWRQIEGWERANPYAMGANWVCAMEVALRAINLLAAFEVFRRAPETTADRLRMVLALFDRHGHFIERNLEFSHFVTSNHYLSDVAGLAWLGIMLPELKCARRWREFGTAELLSEIDKQVLPCGADDEASTLYHRFVLELVMFTLLLCRRNAVDVPVRYFEVLRRMLSFARACLRPDGRAALIGDSDSGQIIPVVRRAADDHAYVIDAGAAVLCDATLAAGNSREEVLWLAGEEALGWFDNLGARATQESVCYTDAGIAVMREGDLCLLLNATGSGLGGRGSHGHNDALSIEVSAFGVPFITDPGTFSYTGDLAARHRFRSTSFHSTAQVDGAEQNTIMESVPFVVGSEASPRIISWETCDAHDSVTAVHHGYERLGDPVTHKRTVRFHKRERFWKIIDELTGAGRHKIAFRFHASPQATVEIRNERTAVLVADEPGERLIILAQQETGDISVEPQQTSTDYGRCELSPAVCWTTRAAMPLSASFILLPVGSNEDEAARLASIQGQPS